MRINTIMKLEERKARTISLTIDNDIVEEMIERKIREGIPISRQLEVAYKKCKETEGKTWKKEKI